MKVINSNEIRIKIITTLLFTFIIFLVKGQDIYKTPSGEKYHLSGCKIVENFSKKLLSEADITKYNLDPYKLCHPPSKKTISKSFSGENKAVGESASVQCKGITQKGRRCKHLTKLSNGYCYQHH